MKIKIFSAVALMVLITGCTNKPQPGNPSGPAPSPIVQGPRALPDNGYRAELSLVDPPAKLRTGQKTTVQVKVKNASDVFWFARGAAINTNPGNQFYLAAANRWLKADESLLTDMDGRYGLDRDLKPGDETQVPLAITAPSEPGEYVLEIDLVQEQVAWFRDKGSPTSKTKISVVR